MHNTLRARLAAVPVLRTVYDRLFAPLYLAFSSWQPFRNLLAPHLRYLPTDLVYSPNGTGLSPELELRRLHGRGLIQGKDVLLVGIQMGTEIAASWLRYQPKSLLGLDLQSWPEEWNAARHLVTASNIRCALLAADGMALPLRDASVDLVSSQGVLEHITDVECFLRETRRVLRPGGFTYAHFGPLWHCYGGPHIGELGYDHLLLTREEFIEKARALNTGYSHWLEKGLYNTCTLEDYLTLFRTWFQITRLALVGSSEGSAFKRTNPARWNLLLQRTEERHLLTRLVSVTARKPEE